MNELKETRSQSEEPKVEVESWMIGRSQSHHILRTVLNNTEKNII